MILKRYVRHSFINKRSETQIKPRSYCWCKSHLGNWEAPIVISLIFSKNNINKQSKERYLWEIEKEIKDILE